MHSPGVISINKSIQSIFATPVREDRLASRGQFRLDYLAAEPVASSEVIRKPWLLKAMAVGTVLDVEIVDKLKSSNWPELAEFWQPPILNSGDGYHIFPAVPQNPAGEIADLLDFEAPAKKFFLDTENLKTWREVHNRSTAHAPRSKELFAAPLLIIPQAPGEGRDRPKSFISRDTSLAFRQGNYGFSASDHPQGEVLVSLLHLITHSLLFQHFCLMVSSRIGASYRTFIKEDIDAFPFPPIEVLSSEQIRMILSLAKALETEEVKPWDKIDDFVFTLYGLDEHDAVVIRDTISYEAPYRSVRLPAEMPPNEGMIRSFCSYLEDMLRPYFDVTNQILKVEALPRQPHNPLQPWRFFKVRLDENEFSVSSDLMSLLMSEANFSAASRVIMHIPEGGLLIGMLNQTRFWTHSRSRLCGLYILRNNMEAFPLP